MNSRWSATLAALSLVLVIAGSGDSSVAEEGSDADQLRESLITLAREHTLVAPARKKQYRLSERPVVHYTNPVRDFGTSDGVTFLWIDRELPVAVSSFSLRRPDDSLRFECVSLSESPLELRHEEILTWSPTSWQTAPQTMPGAPSPAANKARRLIQMRQLCRQFDASCMRRNTNVVTPLRLLPQPLYRFRDAETGVVDGALFAFVISNDPELLLQLVATENSNSNGDGALVWKYSLARMTSLRVDVRLADGKGVWNVPNFYETGKSSTQPYIEGRVQTGW